MTRVDRILARYAAEDSITLGAAKEFPSKRLEADLREVVRQNRTYFNALFGALLTLMVLIIVLVVVFIREPQTAAGILAASGISLPFVIRLLVQLWQAKTQAEALITLSAHLDATTLRVVVKALAQGANIKAISATK